MACVDRPLHHISKRLCRNLTADLCSDATTPEPHLDLWVLQTLGLKDQDTIDMSAHTAPSLQYDARSLGSPVFCSPSYMSNSSLCPSVSDSTPSSVQNHCQSYTSTESQGSNESTCEPAGSAHTRPGSPGLRSDFPAKGLYYTSEASIRSYNTATVFQRPTLTEDTYFTLLTDGGGLCTPPSMGHLLEEHHPGRSELWSPGCRTPSTDILHFSLPGPGLHLSPISSQLQRPLGEDARTSPSAGSQPPPMPQTPRCQTDLAFSMSLSPSSSVKTHSFPQGQAFVRKDTAGRWSFTWVPRQGL